LPSINCIHPVTLNSDLYTGASPGQTKWGGQYGWDVERGVPSEVGG